MPQRYPAKLCGIVLALGVLFSQPLTLNAATPASTNPANPTSNPTTNSPQGDSGRLALEKLKRRFGDKYLYAIDEDDKLIFATNTDAATLDALKRSLLKQAHSQWDQVFDNKPDDFITVVLPTPADYRRIQPNPNINGFYNHDTRILFVANLGTVVMHEFTHAMHCSDIDKLDQNHPLWLMEGMAVLFESSTYEGDVLTPRDNYRFPAVQSAVKANRQVPLRRMCQMPKGEFLRQAAFLYGESASLLMYLYEHNLLKTFFKTFKETYDKDASGILALETVLGKNIAEIETDWTKWVINRAVTPAAFGKDTGVLGIQLNQADGRIRIEQVLADSPAAKARIEVGDIINSIDGHPPRDIKAVNAILKNYRPGETIALKLKREEMDVDVSVTLGGGQK